MTGGVTFNRQGVNQLFKRHVLMRLGISQPLMGLFNQGGDAVCQHKLRPQDQGVNKHAYQGLGLGMVAVIGRCSQYDIVLAG
ncbi:hypothetical protein Xentx_03592 [Xenorhabdus thuongxuanensis]|uniref:Uncharacterized protein n=1 Tax=Xenorhabdus thuongxuanensis TaxID=1873484 RepID=A0A1Q5THK9_9GAMM|nr:hypothetical protein Xentx_03592 [Xenorhabdus thuongxuanensis]